MPRHGPGIKCHRNNRTFARAAVDSSDMDPRDLRATPPTGQLVRWTFGPDTKSLANWFKHDPAFPTAWIFEVANSPAIGVIGDVIDLLLPDPVPGEIDILHDALELACAVEEDNVGRPSWPDSGGHRGSRSNGIVAEPPVLLRELPSLGRCCG
jgi:hypothetical protein